ncbi:MAG: YpmA family protein [Chitinophagales bacterium]
MPEEDKGKLELIAQKNFAENPDLVRVVDFLNKTLKEKKVIFGLNKNKEKGYMTLSIY